MRTADNIMIAFAAVFSLSCIVYVVRQLVLTGNTNTAIGVVVALILLTAYPYMRHP